MITAGPIGAIASGEIANWGATPLQKNGFPAASVVTGCFPNGRTNGNGTFRPGNVTVWKPAMFHFTVSPTCTVNRAGKNANTSECGLISMLCAVLR